MKLCFGFGDNFLRQEVRLWQWKLYVSTRPETFLFLFVFIYWCFTFKKLSLGIAVSCGSNIFDFVSFCFLWRFGTKKAILQNALLHKMIFHVTCFNIENNFFWTEQDWALGLIQKSDLAKNMQFCKTAIFLAYLQHFQQKYWIAIFCDLLHHNVAVRMNKLSFCTKRANLHTALFSDVA